MHQSYLDCSPFASPQAFFAHLALTTYVKYVTARCHTYAINALRNIADSELLPDDIRVLVQQVLELHEKASDPFLGMDPIGSEERQPDKPRVDIETEDAEAQAHQDWSNDE